MKLLRTNLINISDARVTSLRLAMFVQSLDHLPSPIPIFGIFGQPPHQEIGLHCLGSQDVVPKQIFIIIIKTIKRLVFEL